MTLSDSTFATLTSKDFSLPKVFIKAGSPSTQLKICIVVPARNEEEHLWETLSALNHQVDKNERLIAREQYEVLLLLNNCTDESAQVARNFQQCNPLLALHIDEISLPTHNANIGTVRRLLMDKACERLKQIGQYKGIIASTDSDTVVDKHWIFYTLHEINKGADAVGGRILTLKNSSPVRRWHLRDVMYRTLLAQAESIIDPQEHNPWPNHFQYFGASLAVTCQAYEHAGCLPPVPYLEDNAFYKALRKTDARIRKSNKIKVFTSSRLEGRVAVGFSEQLQKWNNEQHLHKEQFVPAVQEHLLFFQYRRQLRYCWNFYKQYNFFPTNAIHRLARLLSLSAATLMQLAQHSLYFGEMWQQVETKLEFNRNKWQYIPVDKAITELRMYIRQHQD